MEHNPYKIGDVVEDHIGKVIIESITISIHTDPPTCVYYGVIINKDGSKSKLNKKRAAFQANLKS